MYTRMALMQTIDESYLFALRKRWFQNNQIRTAIRRQTHRIPQAAGL